MKRYRVVVCNSRLLLNVKFKNLKKKLDYYSRKKKRHTLKSKIVINESNQIICTAIAKGKIHDFSILKMVNYIHKSSKLKPITDE